MEVYTDVKDELAVQENTLFYSQNDDAAMQIRNFWGCGEGISAT